MHSMMLHLIMTMAASYQGLVGLLVQFIVEADFLCSRAVDLSGEC